jgi:UDP-glucose 4,6-dehydratase
MVGLDLRPFSSLAKRFIHVSIDEVYGETEADAIVGNHEASQLLPTNPYSATKAGA